MYIFILHSDRAMGSRELRALIRDRSLQASIAMQFHTSPEFADIVRVVCPWFDLCPDEDGVDEVMDALAYLRDREADLYELLEGGMLGDEYRILDENRYLCQADDDDEQMKLATRYGLLEVLGVE